MGNPSQPIELDGHHFASMREAARHFGINRSTLMERLARGLTPEQAIKPERVERRRQTHCKRGHEFTDENTRIVDFKGTYVIRQCRACARERQQMLSKHCWTWSDA